MDGSLAFGKKQRMQIKDGSLGGENSGGRGEGASEPRDGAQFIEYLDKI